MNDSYTPIMPLSWWNRRTAPEKGLLLIVGVALIVIFALSITIGTKSSPRGSSSSSNPYMQKVHNDKSQQENIREKLFAEISGENIRKNLLELTKHVHVAGTKENLDVMQLVHDKYSSYGLQVSFRKENRNFMHKKIRKWE